MSHFCVLVKVNREALSKHGSSLEAALSAMLRPYQENNMGDCPKEFLKFHDAEEENREEYETGTKGMVRLAEGQVVCLYDDVCYRDPTPEEIKRIGPIAGTGCGGGLSWASKDWGDGRGYRVKVRYTPEGAEELEMPFKDVYPTIEEYLTDWVGHEERDEETGRYGYWENPNAKWDYWGIGGRYSGLMALKTGDSVSHCRRSELAEIPATYAVLDANGWHARGQMGWWGITTSENESKDDWEEKFHERFIDNEDGETILVVVDCHI